jgi:hypothetical protein
MNAEKWSKCLSRVVCQEDMVLLEECQRAANAGALRAAYITIWLSCAESLKRKFVEAATTDGEAKKTAGEIAKKEKERIAVDGYILAEAKKYGFITEAEFVQLEDIYHQRCVYGHPYEIKPLDEQLDAAVVTVVEYILSRPTKLREGYLDRQAKLICTNSTYLDDHIPAINKCAQIIHARSADKLHLWFIQKLWSEGSKVIGDPAEQLYLRRIVQITKAFLQECSPKMFESWEVVNDLTKWPLLARALVVPDLFAKMSEHAQDIIISTIVSMVETEATLARELDMLRVKGAPSKRQIDKIAACLKTIPVQSLASASITEPVVYKRIVEELKSHNWHRQNPAIDALRTLGYSGVAKLDEEQQIILGANVLQAADGHANEALAFLADVGGTKCCWPTAFVEGLVSECFVNDKGEWRYKTKCIVDAFNCLKGLKEEDRNAIIAKITKRITTATPKNEWLEESDRGSMIDCLSICSVHVERKRWSAFTAAVASAKLPDIKEKLFQEE